MGEVESNARGANATPAGCCCGDATGTGQGAVPRMKSMPRSPEVKRKLDARINRVTGQLNGIRTMIDDDRYCGDVLVQLAAVESAVKSISREVMRDHLETCVTERIRQGDDEVVDEVMQLFKKFM
jgi:DNA-binding FrmR family transcriptional regulator